eukprot:9118006-Heterocapsa_arctica.AAC.1
MAVRWSQQGPPSAGRRVNITTYNCQQPGNGARYPGLIVSLVATILALQSTGIKMDMQDQADRFHTRSVGRFNVFEWPWEPRRQYSKSSCGVSIAFDSRQFRKCDVRQVWSAPPALQGRGGALRIRR